jgi:hypothetical protein
METQDTNEVQVESDVVKSDPAPETPVPSEKGGKEDAEIVPDKAGDTEPPVAAAPPAYTPNYKFKSYDQEHEFDDVIKQLIKDEASEKKIRELYEKGHGIEMIKQQRDKTREELKTYKSQYEPIVQDLKKVGIFLQNDDLGSFLKAWDISEDKLLKYALDRANYRQLSPDQRSQIDAQENSRRRSYDLMTENEQLKARAEAVAAQNLEIQLGTTLSRPEIQSAAQAFDSRVGKPGAFRDEILKRGDYLYRTTGRLVPPEQVAQEVIQVAGLMNPGPSQAVVAPNPAGTVVPPQAKPTIPNVASGGTSAVKAKIKSVADLKKRAAEFHTDSEFA